MAAHLFECCRISVTTSSYLTRFPHRSQLDADFPSVNADAMRIIIVIALLVTMD